MHARCTLYVQDADVEMMVRPGLVARRIQRMSRLSETAASCCARVSSAMASKHQKQAPSHLTLASLPSERVDDPSRSDSFQPVMTLMMILMTRMTLMTLMTLVDGLNRSDSFQPGDCVVSMVLSVAYLVCCPTQCTAGVLHLVYCNQCTWCTALGVLHLVYCTWCTALSPLHLVCVT